tara:strand:+ start:1215 stop:1349 length:135 start_codon:yes stop_codon:yes gene_type:complete
MAKKIDKRKTVEKKLLDYVKLQADNKQVQGVRTEPLHTRIVWNR